MDTQKLLDASDVLDQLATRFAEVVGNSQRAGIAAALETRVVQLYLVEVAYHLSRGSNLDEALIKAANGNTTVV